MKLTAVLTGVMLSATSAHALTVTPSEDGNALANSILGAGVTINNVSYSGAELGASGSFSDGNSSGIGIDEGLILTSGEASLAVGPNSSSSTTGAAEGEVTSLTIDFTTQTGDLFFNYVFASEEYNEFVNSDFNDTFDFLLSGPGIAGSQNIALIPGTSTAVEIDTVNNNVNSEFYNDNDADAGSPFDIEYDGFTDVFLASATGLTIGEEYSISLIVSDIGDGAFDSAVFIQGGSFGGEEPEPNVIPVPASLPLLLAGLGGLGILRRRNKSA